MSLISGIGRVGLGILSGGTSELFFAERRGDDDDGRTFLAIMSLGTSEAVRSCRRTNGYRRKR